MTVHVPVLAREVLEALQVPPGGTAVDGTLGGGGHTRLLAEAVGSEGLVLAVDRDPQAVDRASHSLRGLPVKLAQANFSDIPEILEAEGILGVDGILLDLGLSSDQLADHGRGFSFQSSGSLDLRFDSSRGRPAWKLLARASEKHLADLIYIGGQERFSRRIARKIVAARHQRPIRTAQELADLVRSVVPRSRNHAIDPATRTFQALRIAVNEELKWIEVALRRLPRVLSPGGRIAVISFHSLEDRLVKQAFNETSELEPVLKKPCRPTPEEQAANPRSRSARLRVARRLSNA